MAVLMMADHLVRNVSSVFPTPQASQLHWSCFRFESVFVWDVCLMRGFSCVCRPQQNLHLRYIYLQQSLTQLRASQRGNFKALVEQTCTWKVHARANIMQNVDPRYLTLEVPQVAALHGHANKGPKRHALKGSKSSKIKQTGFEFLLNQLGYWSLNLEGAYFRVLQTV